MRILIVALGLCLASGLHARDVDYAMGEQPLSGYFKKAGDNAPLIVLIHDWDGLTDYERKRADMLHALGYNVMAADLFGAGVRPTEVKDKRQHTGELYKDRERMRKLVRAASDFAMQQGIDSDQRILMGYCFGGAAVLEMARAGAGYQAYATFHGGLGTPDGQDYSATDGEVLVFHGTADQAIGMDAFAALAKELEQHGVSHELTSFGGADHAFTVFGGKRYDKSADQRSWARFTGYLSQHFDR